VPIIEDDCFSMIRYEEKVAPSLKALDRAGNVIYISSFSKTLSTGLRIGYLTVDGPAYEAFQAQQHWMTLAGVTPLQRALELYISAGHFRSHIRRISRVCKERRDAMVEAMTEYLPSELSWSIPKGGNYMWVRLPERMSGNELYRVAGEEGVSVSPGSLFFVTGDNQPFIRLNFPLYEPEVLREGIRRLGIAINRVSKQHQRFGTQQHYSRNISV
jgi:DNA-binding transcriptional MocR family regulator